MIKHKEYRHGSVCKHVDKNGKLLWRATVSDVALGPSHSLTRFFSTKEEAWKWVWENDPSIIKGEYVGSYRSSSQGAKRATYGVQLKLFDAKTFPSYKPHELVSHKQAAELLDTTIGTLSWYVNRPDFPTCLLPVRNAQARRFYTIEQVAGISDWKELLTMQDRIRRSRPPDAYSREYEVDDMLEYAKKISAGTKRKLKAKKQKRS